MQKHRLIHKHMVEQKKQNSKYVWCDTVYKSLKTWHNWIVLKTREQFLESWESSYLWEKGGFPSSSAGKKSTCNAGDLGLIPGLRRPPGEGKDHPLRHSGLDSSLDCIVHGVARNGTQLSDFHFHFHFEAQKSPQSALAANYLFAYAFCFSYYYCYF